MNDFKLFFVVDATNEYEGHLLINVRDQSIALQFLKAWYLVYLLKVEYKL